MWQDIDLDTGTVTVNHAVRIEQRRPVIVDELKTEASRRTLSLTPGVVAMLRRHRTAQADERLSVRTWADDRLVFASRVGTPLNPANVRRELKHICESAGVPAILPNELRHSASSIMSDAGIPLEQIADALGHTSTRMLEATYRHRVRPSITAPMAVMEAVLGG